MIQRRKRTAPSGFDYQRLESRQLLAGNVTVSLQGDVLQINGDAASNEIRVTGIANGRAQVIAGAGTTINGGTAIFVSSAQVRNVAMQMGAGNDSVTVENLPINGYVDLDLGVGGDTANLRNLNVRALNVNGRAGNDVIQFHHVFSRDYIMIQTHEGDDTLSITSMATNRGVLIDTGEGADLIAISHLGARANLVVNTGGGNDRVFLTGQFFANNSQFNLGSGDDTFAVLPQISSKTANFGKQLRVQAGDGNDTVFLGSSTVAGKSVSLDGGSGNDSLGVPGANLRRPQFISFENQSLGNVNAALNSFYESLQNSNIDTTPYGRAPVPFSTLTMSSAALKHYGFSPATPADSGLILIGDSGLTVTQATLSITGGYVAGQDLLAFTNTTTISGNFNPTTGKLTLTGAATVAEFQSALRAVTYDNTSTTTLEKTRKLEVVVSTNRGNLSASRDIDLGDQLAIQAYKTNNGLTTQTTASGLHYIIDVVGSGRRPDATDTVRVNYVGKLLNGTQFDANNNISFGLRNVIQGWQEGIPLLRVGGKGRLIIPSSLAYGSTPQQNIPANSVLIFEVELLGIVDSGVDPAP
jgi:FKBP-type peptidyl-prolyl cis-trans isomerase FkpA